MLENKRILLEHFADLQGIRQIGFLKRIQLKKILKDFFNINRVLKPKVFLNFDL
jgi:hypothetical protein